MTACGSATTPLPDRCFIVVARIAPDAPVVTAGQALQLTASYNAVSPDCLPGVPASALHWQSSDPAIATVDSVQGLLTGRRAGAAEITVHAPGRAAILGDAEVRVTGP
jgi:hypothetical protein